MDSSQNNSSWKPRWDYPGEPHAVVVFTTDREPKGTALTLYGERVSQLVAGFLEMRLRCSTEADLTSDVSFLYVLLKHEPTATGEPVELNAEGALAEFGFGESPAAPEMWKTVPLAELIMRAIQWLRGSD